MIGYNLVLYLISETLRKNINLKRTELNDWLKLLQAYTLLALTNARTYLRLKYAHGLIFGSKRVNEVQIKIFTYPRASDLIRSCIRGPVHYTESQENISRKNFSVFVNVFSTPETRQDIPRRRETRGKTERAREGEKRTDEEGVGGKMRRVSETDFLVCACVIYFPKCRGHMLS